MAESYTRLVRARIEKTVAKLRRSGVSLASVERNLGLSEGYLSEVRRSVEPSFPLVALLALIAEDPEGALSTIGRLRAPIP